MAAPLHATTMARVRVSLLCGSVTTPRSVTDDLDDMMGLNEIPPELLAPELVPKYADVEAIKAMALVNKRREQSRKRFAQLKVEDKVRRAKLREEQAKRYADKARVETERRRRFEEEKALYLTESGEPKEPTPAARPAKPLLRRPKKSPRRSARKAASEQQLPPIESSRWLGSPAISISGNPGSPEPRPPPGGRGGYRRHATAAGTDGEPAAAGSHAAEVARRPMPEDLAVVEEAKPSWLSARDDRGLKAVATHRFRCTPVSPRTVSRHPASVCVPTPCAAAARTDPLFARTLTASVGTGAASVGSAKCGRRRWRRTLA